MGYSGRYRGSKQFNSDKQLSDYPGVWGKEQFSMHYNQGLQYGQKCMYTGKGWMTFEWDGERVNGRKRIVASISNMPRPSFLILNGSKASATSAVTRFAITQ